MSMMVDTEMLEVYRVEDGSRRGPYRNYEYSTVLYDMMRAHNDADHPCIEDDNSGLDREPYDFDGDNLHKFAFESLTHLDEWFEPRFRRQLRDLGFSIGVYRVPTSAVTKGDHQLIFLEEMATKIDTISICKDLL